tara:strand:+ start:869 stop:1687 length:819 start_codon:yes stop_codon:yes gene_type:complete
MVSRKDKIKKLVKKMKGKRVPKKKKTGQKQRQKQSVVQNVKVISPQQSNRAIGFPTQIIQTPSSDTEFLRSVIQQQNQNNLLRNYEAKNAQQVVRLNDQIGLRTQEAFPNPPPPGIEPTIPQSSAPSMSDPNVREAMLQQQDEMVAKSNARNKKMTRVVATAVADRKPPGFWGKATNDQLLNLATNGTKAEKAGARKEGARRGFTAKDVKRALAPPPPGEDEKVSTVKALAPRPSEAVFLPKPPQNPLLTKLYETTKDIPVIQKDEKENIFL